MDSVQCRYPYDMHMSNDSGVSWERHALDDEFELHLSRSRYSILVHGTGDSYITTGSEFDSVADEIHQNY